jgi:hypothetical protein
MILKTVLCYGRFFGDKAGSENRSFECPLFELPRLFDSSIRYSMNGFGEPFLRMKGFLVIRLVLTTGHSNERFKKN